MRYRVTLLALLMFQTCSTPVVLPPPVPSPSPSPTPTPVPMSVLHVQGTKFYDSTGKEVFLLGYGGVCCNGGPASGWPWISEAWLRELAAHGGNFVHIRLGPNWRTLEIDWSPNRRPYLMLANGEADLDRWNEPFFINLNSLLSLGESLGVYFEIDLIDAWILKTPDLSPWPGGSNDCSILKHNPQLIHVKWLQKVVDSIGKHPNILWQISNESGVCPGGTTVAWEVGVVNVVRGSETYWGFPRHPIATNGETGSVDRNSNIDYIETHQNEAPEQGSLSKPVMVNEYNPGIGSAGFERQLQIAQQRGTYFQYWPSDDSDEERLKALDVISLYRKSRQ